MKICPRCQKTYADDSLNFCLEDGSVLAQAAAPPPTVQMGQVQSTQTQSQLPTQAGWNVNPQQQYSMQPPKKSSKAWIWVLLILGGLVLVCGGGLGALVYIGSQMDTNTNSVTSDGKTSSSNSSKSTNASKSSNSSSNSSSNNSSNSSPGSTSGRTDFQSVDLEPWVKEFSAYGNTEFTNGEFVMSSKKKAFYYVLVAPDDYTTENADTRVTLRNVDNATGTLGYGLIFHSDPTPLQQDYAFLIDTKRKKYRVVHHEPQKETAVVNWTNSEAIKEGVAENVLEARDKDDTVELYINGTMVTSIRNVYGYAGGVPGLYTGDAVKIAFKNLEIRK